jgi:PAS domain S-box-containing protein
MSEHDPRESSSPSFAVAGAQAGPLVADERLFALLFDVSPFPAVVSRAADGTVIAVNRRTTEIFGVAQSEVAGRKVTDYYVNPAERAELTERIQRDGRADNLRLQIRRPDGTPFWALFSARLVTYGGEPAILTVFTDISDQVRAETTLRASEQRLAAQTAALMGLTARYTDPAESFDERLRAILEVCGQTLHAGRVSMWRFGEGRQLIRCIGMHERSTGAYVCGALLYRREAPAYFDAVERERVVDAHDARTDPRTREFRESYLDVHGIGAMLDVPLRQDNTPIGVLCVEHVGEPRTWTLDEQTFAISVANLIVVAAADQERRDALARVAESDRRATLVVDTAHDAFVGIDSTGRIMTWNAQAERTFGWTRDEAIGRPLAETIIPARFRDAHHRGFQRFHDSGEAPILNRRLELAAIHRSGREFPIELTVTSPMRLTSGYFFGAFLRDISERRERDEQLRQAKESAEAATRAKSEFLANMSHELRTPLNGVLGYSQLLQRDRSLTPTQREALDAIAQCGAHLLDLINDVLDLSRIEAGRVDIEPTATELAQLVTDLRYVVGDAARQKGLQLITIVADDLPPRVVLDGRHVRQVLLNLLSNAIKFTATGEVRLTVGRRGADGLAFEVCDTGIGIEPESQETIFRAFTQTRAGAAAGGTGLGLAISQHLVKRMGGRLDVWSAPGQGSRFFFTLPLVAGEPSPRSADEVESPAPALDARLAPGQDVTALVVDDSTVSRRILASLLESAGARVLTAAGGLEAIQIARDHRPHVIFMDLRMGDIDGLEATRRLAQDPATGGIPVIAVTASAFGDTRQAARDAGCVDYLPKPVRAERLFAALQTHLGVRFVRAGETTPPAGVPDLTGHPARPAVAARLAEAVALGNVTDLEQLARELGAGPGPEAALGTRIAELAAEFDFDGLRALADALAAEQVRAAE